MTVSLDEVRRVEAEADCLFDQGEVEEAVTELAAQVTALLGESNPLILAVMNGGVVFAGRLLPQLPFPLEVNSITATRYGGAISGGTIRWLLEPSAELRGRSVLIVDDVLDEGITLAEIIRYCHEQGAASVHTAVLVEKDLGKPKPCRADFIALRTGNRYLFGYGMDYKGYLRNAPGIYACKEV
ncbi:hypoxanthine-guanine phosphoribosyltransferase [Methylogaea oryzae]|uniref:Hypoxanthine-guanine phosphoribosyltransferase n=1 Tax=Methylogaea oryzae TaxID=1295382 RepID=A0A8D4VNQ2_9GAMM|nr:hypoxanthine-guanine phosphoribosyltransferase [Methylogaea oryzae]BBL71238.1 hypoxanthine-guanine phosphoribosyltransferase [Methylogaea oryzae]